MNLYYFKVYLALLILAHASISDWRYREIREETWLSMTALGFLFFLYEGTHAREFLSSLASSTLLVSVLYRLGLIGGGDGKIIIGIGAMFPTYQNAVLTVFPFPSVGVFANAVFLSALLPVFFFLHNIKQYKAGSPGSKKFTGWQDFLVLFLGYRKKASLVGEYEAVMGRNGKYKFLNLKNELGKKRGEGEVWVTPALPFAIPLTAGFLLSVYWGDMPSYLVLLLR